MKLSISKKRISTPVLISMTDVIFLLLIFLLIASNFASQTGLPVKLPGSTSAQRQAHQVLHIVFVNDNRIEFMGTAYNLDNLGEALRGQYQGPDQVVRLSADRTTELQKVIALMDVIREAGFERIFVATEPPERVK
jgi:biopolymer transport protein ExbD